MKGHSRCHSAHACVVLDSSVVSNRSVIITFKQICTVGQHYRGAPRAPRPWAAFTYRITITKFCT